MLVRLKKRGENLQKHYRQAFDYCTRLVPNRPRWVKQKLADAGLIV